MKRLSRSQKRSMNVISLCIAVALVLIVIIGFSFLLMSVFRFKVPTDALRPRDDSLPAVENDRFASRGHKYDTRIPAAAAAEVTLSPVVVTHGDRAGQGESDGEEKRVTVEAPTFPHTGNVLFSENDRVQLQIVGRAEWLAHSARRKTHYNVFSIEKAIVLETGTVTCFNISDCAQLVRELQKSALKNQGRDDIIYNFLIGGDGSIYEGRGYNVIGDHTPNHNNNSLGIALIGKFEKESPTEAQIYALRNLLQYSIAWEHLASNYELYGHDQLVNNRRMAAAAEETKNPGTKLFEIIKKWPHWTANNFYKTVKV